MFSNAVQRKAERNPIRNSHSFSMIFPVSDLFFKNPLVLLINDNASSIRWFSEEETRTCHLNERNAMRRASQTFSGKLCNQSPQLCAHKLHFEQIVGISGYRRHDAEYQRLSAVGLLSVLCGCHVMSAMNLDDRKVMSSLRLFK